MSTVEAPASHLPLPMQNILSRLAANSTEAEQALVRKAYAYAAAAHAGQVRLSGEPYLSHPLAESFLGLLIFGMVLPLWIHPYHKGIYSRNENKSSDP